jgi:target of rapamycin complex subunit LST8
MVRPFVVNDVLIHPNQGELLSADQNGTIKQWVLASNECDLELVGLTLFMLEPITYLNDLRLLL